MEKQNGSMSLWQTFITYVRGTGLRPLSQQPGLSEAVTRSTVSALLLGHTFFIRRMNVIYRLAELNKFGLKRHFVWSAQKCHWNLEMNRTGISSIINWRLFSCSDKLWKNPLSRHTQLHEGKESSWKKILFFLSRDDIHQRKNEDVT